MATIRSHEDLEAWKLSEQLEDRVYEITARPKAQRDRGFCDDIQRSGRSAPANLSEGFHRFRPHDNARFVRIALGSLGETINHLRHAWKRKYITDSEHKEWRALAESAHRASLGWLTYLESCPKDGPRNSFRTRRAKTGRTSNGQDDSASEP